MLQQPRVPPTGQRQAIEIQIKWREVLANQQALLKILSKTTGHTTEKLAKVDSCIQHSQSSEGRVRPVLPLAVLLVDAQRGGGGDLLPSCIFMGHTEGDKGLAKPRRRAEGANDTQRRRAAATWQAGGCLGAQGSCRQGCQQCSTCCVACAQSQQG